jgi:hydroxyacyl-ACP dehydratase HTD2-like protein with hotdog domain
MTVSRGDVLPGLTIKTGLRQLVKYAGATRDFYELHYDVDFAKSMGHPDVALHGMLKAAYLARMVTDWLGQRGELVEFSVSYRGLVYRDRDFVCGGEVVDRTGNTARIELWGDDDQQRRTTVGRAVVNLR